MNYSLCSGSTTPPLFCGGNSPTLFALCNLLCGLKCKTGAFGSNRKGIGACGFD
ncbi:MAG: hypothetical protein RBR77_04115 [Thauera sp.]|jgi:hypothetical protein|nr:hypothetical protein [Thauera sp.]